MTCLVIRGPTSEHSHIYLYCYWAAWTAIYSVVEQYSSVQICTILEPHTVTPHSANNMTDIKESMVNLDTNVTCSIKFAWTGSLKRCKTCEQLSCLLRANTQECHKLDNVKIYYNSA